MSYNLPNWDLYDVSVPARFDLRPPLSTSNSTDVPLLTYEIEELSWENGQLIVNGLGPGLTRVSSQSNLNPSTTAGEETWEKPRAAVGTLESIVDLATHKIYHPPKGSEGDDINVPLLHRPNSHRDPVSSAAASVTSDMDALVPCGVISEEEKTPTSTCVVGGLGSTRVELEEGPVLKKAKVWATRVPVTGESSMIQQSQSGGSDSRHVRKVDTCEKDSGGFGLTTASFCSQGRALSLSSTEKPTSNTNTATATDDHDGSACLTRPQGDTCDKEDKKKENARLSLSTKRSRAAAIHNQTERKRRETINQKMKTLQKMVPNSSKTDKASMLDEVIDYLKQLQAQAQVQMMMMSRMSIPSMMMPFAMPQHPLHMPMMPPMGMGMPMNMNMINSAIMAHQNLAGLSPVMNPNAAFMPTASWDVATERPPSSSNMGPIDPSTYLAHCQSQPMTMEAYNRMVALIQQQQQQQQQLPSTTFKN